MFTTKTNFVMIRIFLSNIPSVTNDRRSLVGGCILESRKRGQTTRNMKILANIYRIHYGMQVRTFENYEAYGKYHFMENMQKQNRQKKERSCLCGLQKRPEQTGVETSSKSRYRCHQFSTGVSGTSELFSKSSPHIGKYLLSYQQQSV